MKTIVVLLDGLGDRVCDELGGKTPLEYAKTPQLDRLATLGETGMMTPYRLGVPVGTDFAHYLLLGYPRGQYPGRSVVMGKSHEIPMKEHCLYLVTSWATVTKNEHYEIQSRWIKELDRDVSLSLASAIPKTLEGYHLQWHYTSDSHGVLEIEGENLTASVSDPDGIYSLGYVLKSEPYDTDSPDAEITSGFINRLMKTMHENLEHHTVNQERRSKGLEPLNFLLPKWPSMVKDLPSFKEENGMSGHIIGSSEMIRGIAHLLDLRYTHYTTFEEGSKMALESSSEYVHVHTKETDQAAHTKDPFNKVKVLEEIDPLLAPLLNLAKKDGTLVIVTGDHTTPSIGPMIHSGEEVPILFAGKNVRKDAVTTFGERSCAGGSLRMKGEDFMQMILNYHDRALFHNFRVGGRKSKYLPETLNKL